MSPGLALITSTIILLTVVATEGCHTKYCEVHGEALKTGEIPVSYGMPRREYRTIDLEEITRTHFPHGERDREGGCVPGEKETVTVLYCDQCRKARDQWIEEAKREWKLLLEKPDLVIFFIKEITTDEIMSMIQEYDSKPGIGLVSRLTPVSGYEGIDVSFFSYATKSQMEAVKKAVNASPLVYRIYFDVDPDSIEEVTDKSPKRNHP